jgi:hypothetical protein
LEFLAFVRVGKSTLRLLSEGSVLEPLLLIGGAYILPLTPYALTILLPFLPKLVCLALFPKPDV